MVLLAPRSRRGECELGAEDGKPRKAGSWWSSNSTLQTLTPLPNSRLEYSLLHSETITST